MRIVQLNPFFLPYNGGIEKRISAISSRLSGRHEMVIVTSRLPGTDGEERISGARVIRLPSRYFGKYNPPYVASTGIEETISSIGPDLIDYHYRWSGSYNRAFFGSRSRKVMTFHNHFGEGTGLLKALSYANDLSFVRKLRRVDHVFAVSDFIRHQLARRIPDSLISTSYNGIEIRQRAIADGRFALFIGRLVSTKGLKYALRAAGESRIPLKIAGSGPLLAYLKRHAGDGIEVLGSVSDEEKEELLRSCTFLVLPSLQEAFGLVALEAMEHSKPVIASRVGGIPEVVGGGGIMVDRGDASSMAAAMKTLWNDGGLAESLGAEGRRRAELFSWDRIAADAERVYKSVLETDA